MNKYILVILFSLICMNLSAFEREDFWSEWKNVKANDWQIMKAINEERNIQKQISAIGIDVFGQRFRNEEYILQPQLDQMRGIVITYRQQTLNYGELLLTFNRNIDLSTYDGSNSIWSSTWWIYQLVSYWRTNVGAINPEDVYAYVIEAEGIVSNGTDYIKDINKGGYMGKRYGYGLEDNDMQLKFTEYKQIVNGAEKIGYTREKGSQDLNWTFAGGNFEQERTFIETLPATVSDILEPTGNWTGPGGKIIVGDIKTKKYGDGTFIKIERYNYKMKDEEFWFNEVIYTASEFEGRKIDLIPNGYYIRPEDAGPPLTFSYALPGLHGHYISSPGGYHYPVIKN